MLLSRLSWWRASQAVRLAPRTAHCAGVALHSVESSALAVPSSSFSEFSQWAAPPRPGPHSSCPSWGSPPNAAHAVPTSGIQYHPMREQASWASQAGLLAAHGPQATHVALVPHQPQGFHVAGVDLKTSFRIAPLFHGLETASNNCALVWNRAQRPFGALSSGPCQWSSGTLSATLTPCPGTSRPSLQHTRALVSSAPHWQQQQQQGSGSGKGRQQQGERETGLASQEEVFDTITDKIPERPVTVAEGASYSFVILIGLGIAGAALYFVLKELLLEPKEYTVFNKALKRVQKDGQVISYLGSPITGYGQESRNRAARQRISHKVWKDEDGIEKILVQFHIRGPGGSGLVHCEMFKDPEERNQLKFTYLIVDITHPQPRRLMLESYVPTIKPAA